MGRYGKILWNPGKDPESGKGVYVTLDPSRLALIMLIRHIQAREVLLQLSATGDGLHDESD